MTLLQTNNIEMTYGQSHVLKGISLNVEAGKIIGLLGPNASGKTTLMKIIAGLLQPVKGEISYPGGAPRGPVSKTTVSFMPDAMIFPSWMKVKDAFEFYRDLYPDYSDERARDMMKLLDLEPLLGKNIKMLSKGMQERLILALTFSRATSVYLLDEPLGGIDPVGKAKIIEAILAMQLESSSIIVSTHLVRDIERIFDEVHFISNGRIVFSGNCDEMRETNGATVERTYLEVFINEGTI